MSRSLPPSKLMLVCTNISCATFSWVSLLRTKEWIDFYSEKERSTAQYEGTIPANVMPISRSSLALPPYKDDQSKSSQS